MKRLLTIIAAIAMLFGCNEPKAAEEITADIPGFVLSDDMTEVKIGEDGSLLELRNKETGHN